MSIIQNPKPKKKRKEKTHKTKQREASKNKEIPLKEEKKEEIMTKKT